MDCSNEPYALKPTEEQARRSQLLDAPHIAPLTQYLNRLRAAHPDRRIPDFDPCDGGICAKALFLLEAPWSQTKTFALKVQRYPFVSRNNPDPASKNLCLFMQEAHLTREDTLIWSLVPWYVGAPEGDKILPISSVDIEVALPHLKAMLNLLPNLQVIVLMGKRTHAAAAQIEASTTVPILKTYHPSSQVMNVWPEKKREVIDCLQEVAAILKNKEECA